MRQPPAYDRFAPHFDRWQEAFGGAYDALLLPRLRAALDRFAPGARRVADLGIGTGDLVIALASAGLDVVGVDVSPAMLEVARRKIAAAGVRREPALVLQDIRRLRLAPPVDAACCVYTVVNQLTGDGDLLRCLRAVHASLAPGGVFVFETNLPAAYARWWTGEDAVQADGVRIARRHRRLAGGLLEAAITIAADDGTVVHDHILQRPYEDAELRAALGDASFAVEERCAYDPFTTDAGEPTKALWVARAQRPRA